MTIGHRQMIVNILDTLFSNLSEAVYNTPEMCGDFDESVRFDFANGIITIRIGKKKYNIKLGAAISEAILDAELGKDEDDDEDDDDNPEARVGNFDEEDEDEEDS